MANTALLFSGKQLYRPRSWYAEEVELAATMPYFGIRFRVALRQSGLQPVIPLYLSIRCGRIGESCWGSAAFVADHGPPDQVSQASFEATLCFSRYSLKQSYEEHLLEQRRLLLEAKGRLATNPEVHDTMNQLTELFRRLPPALSILARPNRHGPGVTVSDEYDLQLTTLNSPYGSSSPKVECLVSLPRWTNAGTRS